MSPEGEADSDTWQPERETLDPPRAGRELVSLLTDHDVEPVKVYTNKAAYPAWILKRVFGSGSPPNGRPGVAMLNSGTLYEYVLDSAHRRRLRAMDRDGTYNDLLAPATERVIAGRFMHDDEPWTSQFFKEKRNKRITFITLSALVFVTGLIKVILKFALASR